MVWGRVAAVVLLCTASVAKPILGEDLSGDLIPDGQARWEPSHRATGVGISLANHRGGVSASRR